MSSSGDDVLEQADGVGNKLASALDANSHLVWCQFDAKFFCHGGGDDTA
jgi:hypothetical protein